MSADPSNCWWADVLEQGPGSAYASWFDIDWHPCQTDSQNKVLLPILEDHYGRVLHARKLQVVFQHGFAVAYYDQKFPLSPGSYATIIERLAPTCTRDVHASMKLRRNCE
jgi:(1->4)-alpha-D-glucan 1-alpha-D-glucosylmutase